MQKKPKLPTLTGESLLRNKTAIPVGEPLSDGFALWKGFAGMGLEIPVAGLIATFA